MEEKTKAGKVDHSVAWEELMRKAKNDPKRAKQLEAMERVMHENQEVLRRLADS